jgi:hypothetical protein
MSIEKAAAAKILGSNFTLYRTIQQIYPTHRYSRTRQFSITVPSDCFKIKVTGCAGGGATTGGYIGGGGSGGAVAGRWVEDFEIHVVPNEKLYIQIAGGGIPTAAGAPPSSAIAYPDNTSQTYIKRDSHASGTNLLQLSGQGNFGMALPNATQGGQAQLAEASTAYNPNVAQPAAGVAGTIGISMAQFPAANGDIYMTYPPLVKDSQTYFGNYGTNPGAGGGVNTGVGQSGGGMGKYISRKASHSGGGGSGAIAGGGCNAISLHPDRYERYIRKDLFISAYVEPNTGANVVVDTPIQKMWGAGGVGAASGHMGGYGGDGVLIIEWVTGVATSVLDKKILMPNDLIDSVANPSGLAVPSTFIGRHGWVSQADITNGKLFQNVRLSNNGGFLQLQTSSGNTFYNNSIGDNITVSAIGVAGANLTGKCTALSKFNVGDTYNTMMTTNIPIASVSVTVGTQTAYSFKTNSYVPPWNWSVLRSHDSGFDWAKNHRAKLSVTTTTGSNILTFVSSVNNSIARLLKDNTNYANGNYNQGVALTPIRELSGTGIPVGARIVSFDGSNNITMDTTATANGTVTVDVFDITKIELYLASPMSTGKRLMYAMSGTPDWLASATATATNRSITSNVVTITHAALPATLQTGVKILVRNCPNSAVNGDDSFQTTNWTVLAGGSTTTTKFNVPATANETSVADTATEILMYSNEGSFGYMNPPNASVATGYAEVSLFTTWLMTKYGSIIDFIETQNEANSGYSHNTGLLNYGQVQQGIWWAGTFDQLGDIVRRVSIAAKAVKPAVKIGAPSATGLALGQVHYKTPTSRSNIHMMLSAADGVGGKMVDWVDYLAIHIYGISTNRPFNGGYLSLVDILRYYRELFMMESINKPNMDIIMTEGGYDTGSAQDKFKAMSFSWQANEIKKWFILQAGFGLKGVYPFVDGFMGEPARYPEHEAAYIWLTTNLQGKTIHPDSCFNEETGEMYFKNTTGFEEYLP